MFIILIIDIKSGYLERIPIYVFVACLSTSRKTTLHIEAEHSFRDFFEDSILPCLPSTCIESWIDLVKAEVGTSIDNGIGRNGIYIYVHDVTFRYMTAVEWACELLSILL